MDKRKGVLEGIRDAKSLHRELQKQGINVFSNGRVDVYNAIEALEIPLFFRNLKGLLGFCVNEPAQGILVTSARSESIQRFTAAHELGHLYMGHNGSVDLEGDIVDYPEVTAVEKPEDEVAANSFASEFLQPKELVLANIKKAGIKSRTKLDEIAIYNLALTMGLSYRATCWGLYKHEILDLTTIKKLANIQPKKIKEMILNDKSLSASYPNVWRLSEEINPFILGNPNDLIVIDLLEHSSSGYLWDTSQAVEAGLEIVKCDRQGDLLQVGSAADLRIVLKVLEEGSKKVNLVEKRKWETDVGMKTFKIEGKFRQQKNGLPNEVKEKRMSEVG
jgi:Zn-dependent peptidase ImmA (M78 family)/predicted secreted protein